MSSKRPRRLSGRQAAIGLVACRLIFGQAALSLPAWLLNYPGAEARTQTTPGLVESTYQTAANPGEVVAHYRKLFETAQLSFQPGFDGMGTAVRGTAPEGDLLIQIRQQGKGTWVRVDLTARSAAFVAIPAPAVTRPTPATFAETAAQPRENTRKALENADEAHRKRLLEMEKYDQPMRPARRPPPPPLVWPAWLVRSDGAPLQFQKGVDEVGLKILKSSYATNTDRSGISAFYAGLLNSNGFRVGMRSGDDWFRNRRAWLDSSDHALGEPGIDIHVDIAPLGGGFQVDVSMTARR